MESEVKSAAEPAESQSVTELVTAPLYLNLMPYLCLVCGENNYAVFGEVESRETFGFCITCNSGKDLKDWVPMAFSGKVVNIENLSD